MAFQDRMAAAAARVEARLAEILDHAERGGTPERLASAMRYAVLGGGKRFRPFLTIETAKLFGSDPDLAVDAAAAIECIHCYSLVHDDLPQMDNDELRRGQPTVWKAYGEWTAILVGDGLQTMAFEIASGERCHADPAKRSEIVRIIAAAAGPAGMVGGQALDLEAETNPPGTPAGLDHIMRLQQLKTGRLIEAACETGAVLGGATLDQRTALRKYATCLGSAFQISDDLLDAEGQSTIVGKTTGKDTTAGKATLVSLLGLDAARRHLDSTVKTALAALDLFGADADGLRDAATFMGRRVF